jgi:hypothetical protein
MGDKHMADAQQFARRQCAYVAKVKQQRAVLKQAVNLQHGIAASTVYQAGMKYRSHVISHRGLE